MEADVVQSVGIASAKVFLPRFHIHGHMPCQRPDAGIVLASQENLVPIGIEMLPLNMKVLEVLVNLSRNAGSEFTTQFNSPDDTVPVGLRILSIGMAAGVELLRHATAVIHHDGELVLARDERFWQLEHLRRGDIIGTADEFSVDIDLGGFCALKEEVDGLALPRNRDFHLTLIPCTALIGIRSGQMGGFFT